MKKIGKWIAEIIDAVKDYKMPTDKEQRKDVIAKFQKEVVKNKKLLAIHKEVRAFAKTLYLP